VATSDIHLKYKLRKSRAEVLKAAVDAVRHAKGYCEDVEFSPEDASRSDFDYMCDVLSAAIEAGAKTINIPDTVGYAIPREWGERIARIRERVRGIEQVALSVHCHNDLGQAVANSLTAIMNGARQVECTINGIGERAGNASLEEIVMALRTRKDFFGVDTRVRTEEIFKTSRLLSHITGIHVQPNKAIIGENAVGHREAEEGRPGLPGFGRGRRPRRRGAERDRRGDGDEGPAPGLLAPRRDVGQGRDRRGVDEGRLRRDPRLGQGRVDGRHRGE